MTITHADKIAALRRVITELGAHATSQLYDQPRLKRDIAALRAILADLEAQQWRPIEMAPKDGTVVVLLWPYWRSIPVIGRWEEAWNHDHSEGAGWRSDMVNDSRPYGAKGPTYWMPLPPPPEEQR